MPPTDTLLLPGLGNSGPAHWQSHWERHDPTCTRLLQDRWDSPRCDDWKRRLDEAVNVRSTPVCFAAHSSACALVAQWAAGASSLQLDRVRGALLVAPSDTEGPNYPVGPIGFTPITLGRLPFPSIVVASSNDRYLTEARARQFAHAWGSRLVLLPDAGHINAESGHGAWPEGHAMLQELTHDDRHGSTVA